MKATVRNTIQKLLEASESDFDSLVADRLEQYFRELGFWNRRMNLTALDDGTKQVERFLGDTLALLPLLSGNLVTLLDIGTGAGVPGFLLGILRPEWEVILVDAIRKRVSFLLHVTALLGLENVRSHHVRAGTSEMLSVIPRHGCDVVVSQATVSALNLALWSLPLISEDGQVIAMKGINVDDELKRDAAEMKRRNISFSVVKRQVPLADITRSFVIMRPARQALSEQNI
jgi:16S rRNA (guanine527-N7)-methyltransferase